MAGDGRATPAWSEDVERERIARAVAAIREATGVRPVGWHTRSASSLNTRRLLLEEGGFFYDSDAYNDDLPHTLRVGERRHVVLPYAFDTNDMQFQNTNRFPNGGLQFSMRQAVSALSAHLCR